MNHINSGEFETLTIEQFCQRLHICQSEVYRLRNEGKLVPGRHFIKIGRVVRYFWCKEVLQDIHRTANDDKEVEATPSQAPTRQNSRSRRLGRTVNRVNWDIE